MKGAVTVALSVAAGFALALAVRAQDLRFNGSESMPRGVWRTAPLPGWPPERGAVVVACPPAAAASMAVERSYLPPGDCPGGSQPLLKPVGAVPGDKVIVGAEALLVEQDAANVLRLLPRDGAGRPLARPEPDVRRVPADEVWLLSAQDPRSWDSRYFGPVWRDAVRGLAVPVLTVD